MFGEPKATIDILPTARGEETRSGLHLRWVVADFLGTPWREESFEKSDKIKKNSEIMIFRRATSSWEY